MKRLLYIGLVFAELAALGIVVLVVARIRLEQATGLLAAAAGAMLVLSAVLVHLLPERGATRAVTHGLLVVGSIIFMFPFLWLMATSFKYPEEVYVYPPKWIPSVPGAQRRSPYVTTELLDTLELPPRIEDRRWAVLWPRLESALWQKASALLGEERLRGLDPDETRAVTARGLWFTIARALGAEQWRASDDEVVAAVLGHVDGERVEDVWRSVYRCVALGEPIVMDTSRREYALAGLEPDVLGCWKADSGNVGLRRVPLGLVADARKSVVVAYDFSGSDRAVVSADLPLPVPEAEMLSLTVPVRQDRSWHRFRVSLELAGKRYVTEDFQALGNYLWQEMIFKLKDRDARDERSQGIWGLVPAQNPSGAFRAPGRFRIVLTIERSSRLEAIGFKYTQNYRTAWISGSHWNRYICNSLYLVGLTVLGQIVSCSLVAYAFARLKWPGRDALFLLLLGTMMLPGQVTMIPVFLIFKHLGWYNTLKPLWVPAFLGTPFFIFMLRQFMKGIPRTLEEAARIDGCGYFGTFRQILLPLTKPAVAAVGIFTFMGTWNEFMGPLIFVNDQRLYPLAIGLFDLRSEFGGDFGMLMAASSIMILPVVGLFFVAQRYFIEGVTLTGMKN